MSEITPNSAVAIDHEITADEEIAKAESFAARIDREVAAALAGRPAFVPTHRLITDCPPCGDPAPR